MNNVRVFGIRFEAVEAAQASPCGGCVAKIGTQLCLSLPACSADQRDDYRNVVWQKEKGEQNA